MSSDELLARFHSFSTSELVVMAVVTIFVISVIWIAVNNGLKWILILIIINCILWYTFFGIKITSFQEFINTLSAAWNAMVSGIRILVNDILN